MDYLLMLGGSAGALLALGALARGAWRVSGRVHKIADAVSELSPNSGHSIKDAVSRIDRNLSELSGAFSAHMALHGAPAADPPLTDEEVIRQWADRIEARIDQHIVDRGGQP